MQEEEILQPENGFGPGKIERGEKWSPVWSRAGGQSPDGSWDSCFGRTEELAQANQKETLRQMKNGTCKMNSWLALLGTDVILLSRQL